MPTYDQNVFPVGVPDGMLIPPSEPPVIVPIVLYSYDQFGWYSDAQDPERSTTDEPPACSKGQQPNWTGTHWVCAVYVEPAPATPAPTKRELTHLEFRRLFTLPEQEMCDELEVTFESSSVLSVEQKRTLRTGYKDFYAASMVHLDDPAIPPMLGLYVALGYLTSDRPAQILAGQ